MDNSFGPRLLGHFDFTLLFEDAIFHIVPAAVIIFSTLFFIARIRRGFPLVRAGRLLWVKLGVAVTLAAVQIATTVLWFRSPLNSKLSQAASILTCICNICIGVIAYANHIYFIRPLPFLGLFLTVTLLLDAVTVRTYFLRTGLHTIARLHIAIPILKFLLLLLEERSKRSLVISNDLRESLGSESFAGFFNTSLYLWLNPIILFGIRGRITTDFLPGISQDIDPVALYHDFMAIWETVDQSSKYALAKACFYTVPWPYVYVILPRLLFIGFKFAQPFLLQDVINAVSAKTEDNDLKSGLIYATAFVYIGMAFSRSWFLYIKNRMATSTRAILVPAIYRKSLRLSKDESAQAAAVTLINTDVANIMQLLNLSYESWARLLEIILGLIILELFVGTASIFALIPTSLASVFTVYISKKLAFTRKRWNNHIQNRVADTSNMLAQFKDIKMIGLAPSLAKRLQYQQVVETKLALADRRAVVSTFSFSAISETVTPVLVVAGTLFWTRASEPISSSRFFTTLAVVTMISNPLAEILTGLPAWMGALGAVSRIQTYLTQEELKDPRRLLSEEHQPEPSSATGVDRRSSARLRNRQQPQRPRIAVKTTLLSVSMGKVASVLRDVSISIPYGRTTMFTGPVGCGKSSLLRAIAGQAKLSTGSVAVCAKKVAYCAQKPWIRNTTIQKNIIGCNVYNAVLYAQVVFICALEEDIEDLPLGDETVCGSDGCKLSGGQKSRIAMARALYSESEIILLDDPFSSLDMETSSTIRIRLFGESGFLDGGHTTLIMTTSMQQHLVDANDAFRILDNGRVCPISQSELDAPRLGSGPRVTPMSRPNVAIQRSEEVYEKKDEPPSVGPTTDGDKMDNLPETKFGDFSLYSYFAGPAGIARILFWGFLVLIAAIVERMPLIFVRIWLDNDPQNRAYFAGFAAFGVLNPIMNWVACFGFFYLVNVSAIEALHWRLADTTARATFEFLAAEDAGSLLNRFSSDTTTVSQRLPLSILPSTWGLLSVIIDTAVIASGASYAAPIMPVLLIFLFVVQHFYLKTSRQLRALELDTTKLLVRQVTETSTGIDHIRSFAWEDAFEEEFYEILEQTQRPFYFLSAAQQWLLSVLDLFSAGAGTVMVAIALNFPSSASANSMGLAFVSLISFSHTVSLFIRYFVTMEISFGAVARIRAFSERTPLETDDNDPSDLPPNWPRHGRVDFNGVTAVYKSRGEDEEEAQHTALDHVTIVVEPGKTLGLMGRTGSGKTSVLLALLRLVEYSGSISIDGREIKSVPLSILRSRITTITQSGLELRGSVRFNLNPFDDDCLPPNYILTNDMQLGVLRRVGLLTHINSRGGLGEEFMTMKFSEGQKQLFQLARAMLHKQIVSSPILLVDEGTSSVDEDTEEQMHLLIHEFFASSTKIIITHRLSTLNNCDAVLSLQHGKGEAMKVDGQTQNWRQSPDR